MQRRTPPRQRQTSTTSWGSTPTTPPVAADFDEAGRRLAAPRALNHPFTATTSIALERLAPRRRHLRRHRRGASTSTGSWTAPAPSQAATRRESARSSRPLGHRDQLHTTSPPASSPGQIDEARIWNTARSQAQIAGSMNTEIGFPTAGLLGRWGMNEGTGTGARPTRSARNAGHACVATPDLGRRRAGARPCGSRGERIAGLQRPQPVRRHGQHRPRLGAPPVHARDLVQADDVGTGAGTSTGGTVDSTNVDPTHLEGACRSRRRLHRRHELLPRARSTRPTNQARGRLRGHRQPERITRSSTLRDAVDPYRTPGTHVAATYDGSVWRIYVNGKLDGTSSRKELRRDSTRSSTSRRSEVR